MIECWKTSIEASFKMSGLLEKRNVTHDGTCGYRCIADICNLELDTVITRFGNLSNDPDFHKIPGLVEWCDNLHYEFNQYRKKKSLSMQAFLHSDCMLLYAKKYSCLFVIVRMQKSHRGFVEILHILPKQPYESTDELVVMIHEGIKFDCIFPVEGKVNEFENTFRDAAEVTIIIVNYFCLI
jgi:hypothetical protein